MVLSYDVLLVWFQWSALVSILELKLPTNNIKDQDNNDNIDIASTELYYYSILIAQRGSSLK